MLLTVCCLLFATYYTMTSYELFSTIRDILFEKCINGELSQPSYVKRLTKVTTIYLKKESDGITQEKLKNFLSELNDEQGYSPDCDESPDCGESPERDVSPNCGEGNRNATLFLSDIYNMKYMKYIYTIYII